MNRKEIDHKLKYQRKEHKKEVRKLIETSLNNINSMIIYYQTLENGDEEE